MTSLEKADDKDRISDVRFDDERMYVLLHDGREISVPLWWYPRLHRATPEQRDNWEILPFGDALHWPDIDEDLDVHGFLIGAKAPGARKSKSSGIDPRVRAHADIWRAIQEHDGKPTPFKYDQGSMLDYEGRILASIPYDSLIGILAEFGSQPAVVAFLLSARGIIIKWLEMRKDRVIEVKHHETTVEIKGSNDIKKALAMFGELSEKDET